MKKIELFIVLLFVCFNSFSQESEYLVNINKNVSDNIKSKEESFVDSLFPTIPIIEWNNSTKFMFPKDVLDENNIRIPSELKYDKNSVKTELLWGKIISVDKIYEKKVRTSRGKQTRTYIDFICDGNIFTYEYYGDMSDMSKESKSFDLVYLGDIDIAKENLIGKSLYSTRECLGVPVNKNENKEQFLQYEKYTIIDVGTSMSEFFPVRLFLEKNGDKFYVDIVLSNTNKSKIPSSVIDYFKRPFTFQSCFTLDNPKDKYPNISDEMWYYVQRAIPNIGMTEQECRLALGIPKSKNADISKEGISLQQWVYNRYYIYFENGKISHIQEVK